MTTTSAGIVTTASHKFTGKERDTESSLDNFGARYDSSSFGRFLSADPIFMTKHRLIDPQQWNLYAYVRHNPVNLTDPTGLDFYLGCNTSDHSGCTQVQNGKDNVWVQADKNGDATVISSDKKGNLTDKAGNKYTGTFDGKNVTFTQGGHASAGVWAQGTNPTEGIKGTGNFDRFEFTFMNHNSVQNLYAKLYFHGTQEEAGKALEKAGFVHWPIGFHFGQTEYRQKIEGRNSMHFSISGEFYDYAPEGPLTYGDMHDNEYYAGTHMLDHFWHDVLRQ